MAGVELLVTQIFRPDNGDRPSVPNVAIAVGATNPDRRRNEMASVISTVIDAGIKFLAIRVTQHAAVLPEEANMVRDLGMQLYVVDRFQDLDNVMDEVVDETCKKEGKHSGRYHKLFLFTSS